MTGVDALIPPSLRRCRFLEEVEQGTSQILRSAASILESLGIRSAECIITGENGGVSDGNPEDLQQVMKEIEKFEGSVKHVCAILHEQIEITPTPHRANSVPYLDALEYENQMEAEYIEYEVSAKLDLN